MHSTRALTLVVLMAAAGCGEDPKPPVDSDPFLSHEPVWSLEQDTQTGMSCFGNSFAVGDLNADGHKDLVASLPSCGWAASQGQGRLAIYAGTESFFSKEAVSAELRWENTSTATSGLNMVVSSGHVNGDGYDDLLVRSFYGVQVFAGKQELRDVLAAPLFRVPGNGVFGGAYLSDLNGDGLHDLVSLKGGSARIYLSTPDSAEAPFVLSRSIPASSSVRVGDTNGDGAEDLLVEFDGESLLYLGCKQDSSLTCEGPVTAEPVWKISGTVQAAFPDQNGDGRAELFLGDSTDGRTWLHLSEGASGGWSTVPTWSVLGDPLFPGFGRSFVRAGDLNGDGEKTEFIVTTAGRFYLYTPDQRVSADLRPAWAWPATDSSGGVSQELTNVNVLAPGDLDQDGREDLIVGVPPSWQSLKPGKVVVLSGGKVPVDTPEPFLPAKRTCISGTQGKPDVTVDGDVLGRSLYVERRTFSDTSCEVLEGCVNGTGERRLLRFSVSIPNMGAGEVRIPGPSRDPSLYQYDSCHAHDHLIGFAQYELRDAQGTVTATGRKQGFYLIDFTPYCMDSAPPAPIVDDDMVISPGWSDIYTSDLPCQWLDITNVPDGTYSLKVAVDASNVIDEDDRLPNEANVKLTLQGDLAKLEP